MATMDGATELSSIGASRILVVDSDAISRQKWSRMLEIMGYQVKQAGSGEEALAQLELECVDLVFFDLPLPDMGDPEVLHQARQFSSEMLIVVQNSQPTIESTIAAIKVGAIDYLLDIADSRHVVDTITGALRNRVRERERQNELLGQQVESYIENRGIDRGTVSDELPAVRQLITHGSFSLDRQARRLTWRVDDGARQAMLTKGEVDVLASLMSRPGKSMSCQEIVRVAFRYESQKHEAQSIVRPYISRLRRKFADAGFREQPISTVRGQGYTFADPGSESF